MFGLVNVIKHSLPNPNQRIYTFNTRLNHLVAIIQKEEINYLPNKSYMVIDTCVGKLCFFIYFFSGFITKMNTSYIDLH